MSKVREKPARRGAGQTGGEEEEGFAAFFADAYPRLVRAMLPATRDLGLAEELAQEAMTRVFARWSRVGRLESPLGYAYVVASNLERRRHRRRRLPLSREIADPRSDPARQVAGREEIVSALGTLSQGERDAVLLVSFLGLSAEEAAGVLGIEPGSVRSRLHRARASLNKTKESEDANG